MSILLVDDEIRLREALARSLAARGHHVHQASTGGEAISAATAASYDMLLLDINLPDATGWDVLRHLRANGRSLPTVVFSAVPPSAERVREFKPVGVLHKPFPIDALLRLVQSGRAHEPAGGE
jgi:two-component system response regulator QseB